MSFDPGTTGGRSDSRWWVIAKWLKAVQDAEAAPSASNDPKRGDSKQTLLDKIARAKAGL